MTISKHKVIFKDFVQKYIDTGEEPFKQKVAHTGDVVRIISALSKELKLNSNDLFLAQLTALYHDLGRFIQYDKYKTFNDSMSINHAEHSVMVLDELNFLDDLPINKQKLIKLAIIEHNKKYMSDDLNHAETLLSMLIRDADKLSNFPFFINNYDKFKLPSNDVYCDEFIELILNKTPISNSNLHTIEDYYLYHLSWFNDLNYLVSINYAFHNNFINPIIARVTDHKIRERLTIHFNSIKMNGSLHQKYELS